MKLRLGSGNWRLVLASIYLASVAVLIAEMASPVNIQIVVHREEGINVKEITRVYTFTDMLVTATAAVAMTSSALLLVLPGTIASEPLPLRFPQKKALSENEERIYSLLKDKGGVAFQTEIVETLNLSKSTVSITLDKLEAKGLVERRKRGMSNVVVIRHGKT